MSKNKKWSTGESRERSQKPMHGVLFVSRNKDNTTIEGFKERRRSFLTTKAVPELMNEFHQFVSGGVTGEMTRFYFSVNSRSQEKSQKALMHKLLDEQVNLAAMESILASVAMKKENAETSKWMFDFDGTEVQLPVFLEELQKAINETPKSKSTKNTEIEIGVHKTPNGFAVTTSRGFYSEPLMEKMKKVGIEVELKRDDFICVAWTIKE